MQPFKLLTDENVALETFCNKLSEGFSEILQIYLKAEPVTADGKGSLSMRSPSSCH